MLRMATFVTALGVIVCMMGVAGSDERTPNTHTVTIESMRFQPDALTVASGDTIVWVNKDLVPHTATSKDGGFDSKEIQADESWRYTIQTAGDFVYVCAFHPTMRATLRVK